MNQTTVARVQTRGNPERPFLCRNSGICNPGPSSWELGENQPEWRRLLSPAWAWTFMRIQKRNRHKVGKWCNTCLRRLILTFLLAFESSCNQSYAHLNSVSCYRQGHRIKLQLRILMAFKLKLWCIKSFSPKGKNIVIPWLTWPVYDGSITEPKIKFAPGSTRS